MDRQVEIRDGFNVGRTLLNFFPLLFPPEGED